MAEKLKEQIGLKVSLSGYLPALQLGQSHCVALMGRIAFSRAWHLKDIATSFELKPVREAMVANTQKIIRARRKVRRGYAFG
ncbi:hypothetical protein G6N74_11290 [Mesorhizobium sp. CGMCC 1.15528]|uniref:Uncharacterized protein n=1 Tax=Mesorhizobium zhangyense TaxID=1776730 RepID=A0A7C9R737_9HYPH|nr:hypothetical protein [Mesorhizobium zhangyense]NGN41655.1 hypothetical protein [Mesorhizobium zhangyense]